MPLFYSKKKNALKKQDFMVITNTFLDGGDYQSWSKTLLGGGDY